MSGSQSAVSFNGNALTLVGRQVQVGDHAPDFQVTANDMSDLSLQNLQGKVVVLSAIPSIDTPTCAIETKRFNDEAANRMRPHQGIAIFRACQQGAAARRIAGPGP